MKPNLLYTFPMKYLVFLIQFYLVAPLAFASTGGEFTLEAKGEVALKNGKTPKISFGNDGVLEKHEGNPPKITDDSKEGYLESRVVFLESEMKKLKSKNINQNEELKIVKKRLSNIDKTVMTLSEKNKENDNSQKSPPSTILKLGQKPTNCEELELIGYNLNGFYLVQEKQEKAGSKINVEAVYCDFSSSFKPQISNKNKENGKTERIGYINIKSLVRGVQFYVQRDETLSGSSVNITFQLERLNVGRAMNLTTGVFTAPVFGTYFFSFSAIKGRNSQFGTEVYLYHNNAVIGTAFGSPNIHSTLSLHAVLELKEGDKVYLVKGHGDDIMALNYHDPVKRTTHFSGWLVQEGV